MLYQQSHTQRAYHMRFGTYRRPCLKKTSGAYYTPSLFDIRHRKPLDKGIAIFFIGFILSLQRFITQNMPRYTYGYRTEQQTQPSTFGNTKSTIRQRRP